eukprot:TRINITY_DN5289_c0_g1_i1.p1 TRINITY_DN5289_c0_g1~~TRINITY_DN5289_c0_g1_i1.p1  ORF type:complete len:291 (-),score=56.71 TRINITY_DN5289_c0_g1_i1:430-1302(-)
MSTVKSIAGMEMMGDLPYLTSFKGFVPWRRRMKLILKARSDISVVDCVSDDIEAYLRSMAKSKTDAAYLSCLEAAVEQDVNLLIREFKKVKMERVNPLNPEYRFKLNEYIGVFSNSLSKVEEASEDEVPFATVSKKFLDGLFPVELSSAVREHNSFFAPCKDLSQLIDLMFLKLIGVRQGYFHKSGGFSSSGPDAKSKGSSGGSSGRKCYNCGDYGHISPDCPKPKEDYKKLPSKKKATYAQAVQINNQTLYGQKLLFDIEIGPDRIEDKAFWDTGTEYCVLPQSLMPRL